MNTIIATWAQKRQGEQTKPKKLNQGRHVPSTMQSMWQVIRVRRALFRRKTRDHWLPA